MGHILYFAGKLHRYAGNVLYANLLGKMLIGLLDGVGVFLLIPMLKMSGILQSSPAAFPFSGLIDHLQLLPATWGLLLILLIFMLLLIGQSLIKRNLNLRDIKIHTGFINHLR